MVSNIKVEVLTGIYKGCLGRIIWCDDEDECISLNVFNGSEIFKDIEYKFSEIGLIR